MNCRDYIFQLTSGKLEQAGWLMRGMCTLHHFVCRSCRNFAHNDQQLLDAVQVRRVQMQEELNQAEGSGK